MKSSIRNVKEITSAFEHEAGYDLIYQSIPVDGHCLYNAVALYCELDQQTLRNIVAGHIRNNLDEYQGLINGLEGDNGRSVNEYLIDIEVGKEWADNLEIAVLMKILDRPIIIVESNNRIKNLSNVEDNNGLMFTGEPIFVYYNGHNHYDALIRRDDINISGIDIFNKLKQGNINIRKLGKANTTNVEVISCTSLSSESRQNSILKKLIYNSYLKTEAPPKAFIGVNRLPVGSVTLGDKLGEGQFGKVYKGNWNGKLVAMKKIGINLLAKEEIPEALGWEVSRLSTVSHPNLVQFNGIYEEENSIYIVTELCKENLEEKLKRMTDSLDLFGFSEWQWALQITLGLSYLHEQGVLHRDFKADNILIGYDNRARLADFGLAQVDCLLEDKEFSLISEGCQNCTFRAPELIISTNIISTKKTDIYALGLIFWQLVTKHNPRGFGNNKQDQHDKEIIAAMKAGEREKIPDSCLNQLKDLIVDCWKFTPEERPSAKLVGKRLIDMAAEERYPNSDLVITCERIEELIHHQRLEILKYKEPYLTEYELNESADSFWTNKENKPDGYDLVLMSTLLPQQQLEQGKLYLKYENNRIKYNVLNNANEKILGYITTNDISDGVVFPTNDNLEQFSQIKEAILKVTSNRGHTQPNDQLQFLNLKNEFKKFLENSDPSTLLLLGEGGLGKTLSTYHIANQLMDKCWQYLDNPAYTDNLMPYLPIPIRSTLTEWSYQKLSNALKEFSDYYPAIKKEGIPLLVIIDGYDECQTIGNYKNLAEHLGITAFPNANKIKLLVTCRVNAVEKAALQSSFNFKGNLQVYYFLPFKVHQLLEYLKDNLFWDESTCQDFKQTLSTHTKLRKVLRNPFVLSLFAQIWDTISGKDFKRFNRFQIYEKFIEHWINTQKYLLSDKVLEDLVPNGSDLIESFKDFASNVALTNFRRKEVSQTLSSSWLNLEELIKKYAEEDFDDREKNLDTRNQHRFLLDKNNFTGIMLIRLQQFNLNSPLKNRAKQYEFSHRSFFEYFIAKKILQMSKLSFEEALFLLNNRAIQEEPEALIFIREGEPTKSLEEVFFRMIEHSKQDESISQFASANAITILNAIRVSFSGLDFKGIKISGADLTGAILDNTDLEEADLRAVKLQASWLGNTNFKRARMEGVILGELAYTQHDHAVKSCCYSSDGKYFAAAGGKSAHVYFVGMHGDLTKAESITIDEEINSCCFSFDNKYFAASTGNNIMLYSREEKKEESVNGRASFITHVKILTAQHHLTGHTNHVNSITFSYDNRWLASGSDDSTIKLWKLNEEINDNQILTASLNLTEHTNHVNSVTFSYDNRWLASGGNDRIVRLWNLTEINNNQILTASCNLTGHTNHVNSITFSYDSLWLASGGNDRTIRIWSLADFKCEKTLKNQEIKSFIRSVAFSCDNLWLASGYDDNIIRLWSLADFNVYKSLAGHNDCIRSVAFSYNHRWLASGSDDKKVRLWNLNDIGNNQAQAPTGHHNRVYSVAFSHNKQWLASGSWDKTIIIWNVSDLTDNQTLTGHTDCVTSVAFSNDDNDLLASGSWDKTVLIWKLTDLGYKKNLTIHHGNLVTSVAFSCDKKWLASGSWDKIVHLHSLESDTKIILNGHVGHIYSVNFSHNSQWLASGGQDNKVILWKLTEINDDYNQKEFEHNNNSINHTLDNGIIFSHTDEVNSIAFSHDNEWLASGSDDNIVRLWSIINLSDKPIILTGHEDRVNIVVFHNDKQSLFSVSSTKIILWEKVFFNNRYSWLSKFTFTTNFVITSLTYSPNSGKFIFATGGDDYSVRIFKHFPAYNKLILISNTRQIKLYAYQTDITSACLSASNVNLLTQRGATGIPTIIEDDSLTELLDPTKQIQIRRPNKEQEYIDDSKSMLFLSNQSLSSFNVDYKFEIEGKLFTRQPVVVDGDCGFTAFGMTRENALSLLSSHIELNNKITELLKIPLRESIIENKFRNYIKQQEDFPNYIAIFDAYADAAEKGNTEEASSFLEQLEEYVNDINFLQHYINYDIRDKQVDAGWVHPAVLQALAEIQNLRLNIFTAGTDSLIPHPQYPTYPPNEGARAGEINLLFINGNHFERLEPLMNDIPAITNPRSSSSIRCNPFVSRQ